jgi:hypothetical protein
VSKGQRVPSVYCDEYATVNALANGAHITHPFDGDFATSAPGREQPSGRASGRQWVQNRGVVHAPAPSVTPAKYVSCAAKAPALVVLPFSLQVVGVERLATAAFADTGSSTIGFD